MLSLLVLVAPALPASLISSHSWQYAEAVIARLLNASLSLSIMQPTSFLSQSNKSVTILVTQNSQYPPSSPHPKHSTQNSTNPFKREMCLGICLLTVFFANPSEEVAVQQIQQGVDLLYCQCVHCGQCIQCVQAVKHD